MAVALAVSVLPVFLFLGALVLLDSYKLIPLWAILVAVAAGSSGGWSAKPANFAVRSRGITIPGTDGRLIYAVGDIVPGLQLAHRGFQQGIFVAEEIAGLEPRMVQDINIPKVTYSDPEVASIGYSEAKAKEQFGEDRIESYEYSLGGNAKSEIVGTTGSVISRLEDAGKWQSLGSLGCASGDTMRPLSTAAASPSASNRRAPTSASSARR